MNNTTNSTTANFDPYLTWLGIRDPQRPPNHYRLLGLELFENDPEVIAAAADRQMTYVRTYQAGQQGEHSQRILNELTTAKLCLLKPERKRDYDDRLRAALKPAPPPKLQPAPAALPQARPLPERPARPATAEQPIPGSLVFASPAGSPSTASKLPPKKNMAMQWSIVGGLVLVTIILTVILANKFSAPEDVPVANNSPAPKVTPTGAKNTSPNPASNPSETSSPEVDPATDNSDPDNSDSKNTEPSSAPVTKKPPSKNTNSSSKSTSGPSKSPSKGSTKNSDEQRPGPAKALPNVSLPGIEDQNPTMPKPGTPSAPGTTVATNNDPLNSLPTSNGNSPTNPQPPKNPSLVDPFNPSAMPNSPSTNPTTNPQNGGMTKPPAPRRPMPSVKEIAENRAEVREVFKTDYASRDIATLTSLGKRLHKMAQESSSKPAVMYTAYDEARIVSAGVNDLETVFSIHEEVTREFDVDPDRDLVETLKAIAKNVATLSPENAGTVLDIINESVNAAIMDQRIEGAEQLLRFVSNFTGRLPDKATREIVFRDLQKKLGEHKAFAVKAKEYKETLAKNPSDGEANLELGKFWAFQQGNFEQGLNYLAKGSDAEIRDAAQRELSLRPDVPDFVKVAEAWWEVANKLPAEPRAIVKVHSAFCYARALPSLKALDRGLAESRINEAYKMFKPNNREVKELMKLLLTRTNWKMEWKSRYSYSLEPTLAFNPSGTLNSYEYPTWKLLENGYVVCFRDRNNPDRSGNPFASRFGRFGNSGNGNNNNGNNSSGNPVDYAKNVMQIAVTANRIEVRVLNNDGELRATGTGTPD